jgi:hypothetical protein
MNREKLPYEWGGIVVNIPPKRSFAILIDRRKNQQILVQEGDTIHGTSCKLLSVAQNEIKVGLGDEILILAKPMPWDRLPSMGESKAESPSEREN